MAAADRRGQVRAGLGVLGRLFLEARPVAGGLGLVAAGAHVAPAAAARRRGVEEGPAAAIVGAHPEALGAPRGELLDDRLGNQRERIVDRRVRMSMPDPERGAVELQAGRPARLEHRVHEMHGVRVGLAPLDHSVDHLAERAPNSADAGQIRVAQQEPGVGMDQLVLQEPDRRVGRLLQVLVGLVLVIGSAVTRMQRVQEVEGGLEIDAVRVLGGRDVWHVANHSIPLDRLRARA
jgi:hypothetical protein